jgi:AraC-like DNA-binding protein
MEPVPSCGTDGTLFWRPPSLGGTEFAYTSQRRYAFPRHFHEEYVIAIMLRGVERLRHTRGANLVTAGSLILLNPGEVHENGAVDDAGFAYRTLYVPKGVVERTLADADLRAGPLPGFVHAAASDPETFRLLRRLHLAVQAGEPVLRLQSLLALGLAQLFRRHAALPPPRRGQRPSQRRITLVQEYLDAHFAEKVSLDDLGRLAGLSPFHLVRSFREEVGMPPCRYQIQRRVLHALARLRQGVAIPLAALEAGFVDQSHLHRHMKRILGVTPGQFRADRKGVQDRPRG